MPTETIGEWEDRRGLDKLAHDIGLLPEIPEPPTTEGLFAPEQADPVTLLERSCGGWRTELRLLASGEIAVVAQQGYEGRLQAVVVAPEHALDAFNHPYAYLPA